MTTFKDIAGLYDARDFQAVTELLATIEETDANRNERAYYLGLALLRLKDFTGALFYLENLVQEIQHEERIIQCRLMLAYIYSQSERIFLARYELAKILEHSNLDEQLRVRALAMRAHLAWLENDEEGALQLYREALVHDPENANILNGLGYVLATSGRDKEEGLRLCLKALEKDPANPAYLDSVAWAYHALDKNEEAMLYIRKAYEGAGTVLEIRYHARALGISSAVGGSP